MSNITEPLKCKHCKKTIGYRRSVTSIGEPLGTTLDVCVDCHGKPNILEEAKKHKLNCKKENCVCKTPTRDYWEGIGETMKKYGEDNGDN